MSYQSPPARYDQLLVAGGGEGVLVGKGRVAGVFGELTALGLA